MPGTVTHEVSVLDGYAAWAAHYDQEENALISIEERLTAPLLAPLSKNTVLDLGTGTGRYAIRLAAQGAHVTALDQSAAMLAVAEQAAAAANVAIQFGQHALDHPLPFEARTFDLLIAALVLCHVEQLEPVLADAFRVLRPGGHLLITDFHPDAIAKGWRTQFTHADMTYLLPTAHHTRDHYLATVHEAGFAIQTVAEAAVRDSPAGAFPSDVLARDGDLPFCLVILAVKPAADDRAAG